MSLAVQQLGSEGSDTICGTFQLSLVISVILGRKQTALALGGTEVPALPPSLSLSQSLSPSLTSDLTSAVTVNRLKPLVCGRGIT